MSQEYSSYRTTEDACMMAGSAVWLAKILPIENIEQYTLDLGLITLKETLADMRNPYLYMDINTTF